MYKILRTILFFFPPEGVHHFSMKGLRLLCSWGPYAAVGGVGLPAGGETEAAAFGVDFSEPGGVGAGFDKNALYLRELEALGFGFVEIGTVTPKPQAGNEQPRLFRLPQDQALINRMGFNNDGAEVIAGRLRAWRGAGRARRRGAGEGEGQGQAGRAGWLARMIVGGISARTRSRRMRRPGRTMRSVSGLYMNTWDYFVVNVSSPNTPGLRALQDKDALRQILTNLQRVA
jgi:dihydroorotate dehydrogenase